MCEKLLNTSLNGVVNTNRSRNMRGIKNMWNKTTAAERSMFSASKTFLVYLENLFSYWSSVKT